MASPTSSKLVTAITQRSTPATICHGCPEIAYVQLTIPEDFLNVRRITITVTSHDQGFVDDPKSWNFSFFHAMVVAPDGHIRHRWQSFVNRLGNREPHTQSGSWPVDDYDRVQFETFRANDTIQLIPLAHYVGWRNFVLSAEIVITGEGKSGASTSQLLSHADAMFDQQLYEPLNRKEIRVLRLMATDPISCTLEHVKLDDEDRISFEALSYCWGNFSGTHTVQVNGRSFSVKPNLYEALLRLRRTDGQPRSLWIDAICINQDDDNERSEQVQMMKEIFSTAERVVVWLGEQRRCLGNQHAPMIRDFLGRDKDLDLAYRGNGTGPSKAEQLPAEALDVEAPSVDFEIGRLFQCSWFHRVWVVQEIHNARDIVVLCGDQACSWSLILQLNGSSHQDRLGAPLYRCVLPTLFSDLFALTRSDTSGKYGYAVRPATADWLEIVIAGLDLDATDPRDKLFALLSFMPQSTDAALKPDYTKSVSDVFRDFTRWWIMTHRSLRILSAVHCSVGRTWLRLSSLPSLPDSTERSSWSLWHDGKSSWGRATLGLSSLTTFKASRNTEVDVSLLDLTTSSKAILLKGRNISVIRDIKPFPYWNALLKRDGSSTLCAIYDNLFDPVNRRTIFAAGSPSPPKSNFDDGTALSDRAPNRNLNDFGNHVQAHWNFANQTGGAFECHSSSFFLAGNGNAGFCPQTAQIGDLVVVLYGGQVPYLLREIPGEETVSLTGEVSSPASKYRRVEFIGECYLSGYMAGEAMNESEGHEEIFELV